MLRFSMVLSASHRVAGWGGGSGAAVLSFRLRAGRPRMERKFHHTRALNGIHREACGVPRLPVDFGYLGGSKLRLPFSWVSLWMAMRRAKADFYVLKTPAHLLPVMTLFCRCFGKTLGFWAQTSYTSVEQRRTLNKWARLLEDWGVKGAGVVIAQTKEQQRRFAEDFKVEAWLVPSICERFGGGGRPVEILAAMTKSMSYGRVTRWRTNAPKCSWNLPACCRNFALQWR